MVKKGDKYRCINTINNIFDMPLYIKDHIYSVLGVDDNEVVLDHILYGNEFAEIPMKFLHENFINIREERKEKLKYLDTL